MSAGPTGREPRSGGEALAGKALVRRLESLRTLSEEARHALLSLPMTTRQVDARSGVLSEHDRPSGTTMIVSGVACRVKMLPDGRRQILGWLLPGDFVDLQVIPLRLDHTIASITPCKVAVIPEQAIQNLLASRSEAAQLLWLAAVVQKAIGREWLVSLGRRSAYERMAHAFCEFYERLAAIGLASDGSCEWPFTQADLGDALGLSQVHVNRTLQDMRAAGLIEQTGRRLRALDMLRLRAVAMFDPKYLQPDGKGTANSR